MNIYRQTCLICVFSLFTAFSFSQDVDSGRDLMDLSLKELLSLEVSVVSNEAESILKTPAIVSRYEASDMEGLGLETLADMLAFIPGLVPHDSEIATTALMIRGLVEGFNQKVLFMLDGVPYWQANHGDNVISGIPFEAISHVEVIRGPGGIIYGTNATGGVVNVVTRKTAGGTLVLRAGSNSLFNGGFYHGWAAGKGTLNVSMETRDEDGYTGFFNTRNPPPFYPSDTPLEGEMKRYKKWTSFMAQYQYKNFKAMIHTFESEASGLAAAASIVNKAELQYQGWMAHLEQAITGDKFHLKLFADYNNFFLEIPTANLFGGTTDGIQEFADNGRDNFRWRAGAHFNYRFGEKIHFLNGVDYEKRSSGEYGNTPSVQSLTRVVTMEPQESQETSLFSQLDFRGHKWRFQMGARFTDNDRSGSEVTPRSALVYQINHKQSLKLLYSVGFNSPNFIQTSLQIPFVVAGDPNLIAERLESLDLAWTISWSNNLFVVNAYHLTASDFIARVPNPNAPGSIFSNSGNFDRTGLELDWQKAWEKGKLFANMAWHREGGDQIDTDPTALFAPEWNISAGSNIKVARNHGLGGSVLYSSAREAVDDLTLVNLKYTFKWSKLELSLAVKNLLGETIVVPDIGNFNNNRLSPGGDPDMNGTVTCRYRF